MRKQPEDGLALIMLLALISFTLVFIILHDQQRTQIEELQVDRYSMEVELQAKHVQLDLLTRELEEQGRAMTNHERLHWLDDIAEGKR